MPKTALPPPPATPADTTPPALLRTARAVIADPKHWTTGVVAKTAEGHPCLPDHPDASCWCGFGALALVVKLSGAGTEEWAAGRVYLNKAAGAGRAEARFTELQDRLTHEEMLTVFDRAIELAEADA